MIPGVFSFNTVSIPSSCNDSDSDSATPLYLLAALTMAVGLSTLVLFFNLYNTRSSFRTPSLGSVEVSSGMVQKLAIIPTKEEFIAAVRAFEKEHKIPLRDILKGRAWSGQLDTRGCQEKEDPISPENCSLRQAFFTNPTIYKYLTRPASSILFLENRPALYSNSERQDQNDYLECLIYELASPPYRFLPLRGNVLSDTFYLSGISYPLLYDLFPTAQNAQYCVYPHLIPVNSFADELVIAPQISDCIPPSDQSVIRVGHLYQKARYVLFPLVTNDRSHATIVMSIFQDHSHQHLVSIFLNSWDPTRPHSLSERISSLFNKRKSYHRTYEELRRALEEGKRFYNDIAVPLFSEEENEALCSAVKKKLPNDSLYFLDETTRSGYLFSDEDILPLKEDLELPLAVVMKAFEQQKIDTFYGVLHRHGHKYYRMEMRPRSIELLDASHHLQLDSKDENCVIYRLDFIAAMLKVLDDSSRSEHIYRLAETIGGEASHDAKASAKREMRMIFQEDLKQFLPQYYNPSGYPKSETEIKDYHLRRRWDLGNLSHIQLSRLGYLPQI